MESPTGLSPLVSVIICLTSGENKSGKTFSLSMIMKDESRLVISREHAKSARSRIK